MPDKIIFTDSQVFDICRLYESGKSTRDIAIIFGKCSNTISQTLKTHGIKINKSRSISVKLMGRPSPRMGVKLSIETRKKIGFASIGRQTTLGKKYSDESKKKMSCQKKKYIAENPEKWAIHVEKIKQSILARSLSKEERLVRERIRGRCKNMLRRLISLRVYTKKGKTHNILGYTNNEFKKHIESFFEDGMSWEKRESFHVDHIVPISAFIQMGIVDPKIINSLINLRPMSRIDNQLKSDNYDINNFESDLNKIKASI